MNTQNRLLVVAPLGADARNINDVLTAAGFEATPCRDLGSAVEEFKQGGGAFLITEEAMASPSAPLLAEALQQQPAWSDVPVILITTGGKLSATGSRAVAVLGAPCNLALIERPLRTSTLIAAMKTALRARGRQYEIRDLLIDREKLLASLEERVAERTAKLQQMVEELEAFSYSVSHDLRAPLRVLEGYASALTEDYGDSMPDGARDFLARIARAASRMDRLTQDLLAYSRVSRAELVLEPVDLDHLLTDVIEHYPSLVSASDCIHVRRPLGIVQGHGPSLVQCFSNLLENALKFVQEGRAAHIEITSEIRGDRLRTTVADQGMGIAPEHQQKIFGMFERAAAHKLIPGTGIGLAIVKKAVERMGGTLGVESSVGNGARFWIELGRVPPA